MIYHVINYIVAAWAFVMVIKALWRGSEFEKIWKKRQGFDENPPKRAFPTKIQK